MLRDAAGLDRCPEREKYVILLLDEMHIRHDLVFDKHTGNLIGFTNLGDISDHLSEFEQTLQDDGTTLPHLAKTMLVFMVRGLFSKLQFPYVQFSCTSLTGVQMYDPFWEAVGRLETMELKVILLFQFYLFYYSCIFSSYKNQCIGHGSDYGWCFFKPEVD